MGEHDRVRVVVLVKQVPDLRSAAVGMSADGTIERAQAPAVTNPADLHALEAALQLGDEVWAVSMGPPRAEEVLRDAIARGADRGVLLCDRAFAGSDTWATANALAAAVTSLGGADLVLAGLTAIDGETGQVGPEVAQRLGLPQATGCDGLELDGGRLIARRIVEGGYERLALPLPALCTVAETGFLPRYPTLPGRRRAERAAVERLTAADLGLGTDRVGLQASPTKVAHVEPAPLPDHTCRMVGDGFDLDDLVDELRTLGALEPGHRTAEDPREPPPPGDPLDGEPALWVVAELVDGDLAEVSAELISQAVDLAPGLGGGVGAVVVADDPGRAAEAAAAHGADVVYCAADPPLSPYRCQPHTRVVVDAVRAHRPVAVLFGATTTGRDLAPRVAAELDAGLAADCTDLAVAPWERHHRRYEALLHQIRPAMGGGVLATCLAPEARPQIATVRPGVFAPRLRPCRSRFVDLAVRFEPADLVVEVLDRRVDVGDTHLADADVIVAGGAGCDASSWSLVEDLASAVGGAVAATRAAVEAGLAPRSRQVGQTGTTVHPRLYIGCGVSGALQHLVGMRSARTVVAVNRDPDAYLFRFAHYGVVGEVADVLPQLTEALRRRR